MQTQGSWQTGGRGGGDRVRPVVCPDPQRCLEGTVFTVSSSALLGDPGDTEYTPSVEGPGVLDVKGLSWLRLFWGPSDSPRVPPRCCGVRTSLQAPRPTPRFITPVGCQGPTQPPAFLCHLQGILRVPGSIVRGAQS